MASWTLLGSLDGYLEVFVHSLPTTARRIPAASAKGRSVGSLTLNLLTALSLETQSSCSSSDGKLWYTLNVAKAALQIDPGDATGSWALWSNSMNVLEIIRQAELKRQRQAEAKKVLVYRGCKYTIIV